MKFRNICDIMEAAITSRDSRDGVIGKAINEVMNSSEIEQDLKMAMINAISTFCFGVNFVKFEFSSHVISIELYEKIPFYKIFIELQ